MKFIHAALMICAVEAFAPTHLLVNHSKQRTMLQVGSDPNLDLSGNTWKPTEGRMQSTDTGDYAPTRQEDIDMVRDLDFTDGIYGSQVANDAAKNKAGPQLPGMEHLGEDAILMGGIEVHEDIPEGMEFIPASVPDGHIDICLPVSSTGQLYVHEVKPFCMGFEDYYAAFTNDSDPVFRIQEGAVGRMDRRGGESTYLDIICDPKGHSGEFQGTIVVNLPDDDSKLTYTVKARTM